MRIVLVLLLLCVSFQSSWSRPASPVLTQTGYSKVHIDLMVMVLSYDGDVRRNCLRETWLKDDTNQTHWVFILGNIDQSPLKEKVLEEQKKYNDIIILNDVVDDYSHLSDKVLKGLAAVYSHYTFDYLLKVDTDTFVILPSLLELLLQKDPTARYMGFLAHTKDSSEIHGFLSGIYYMLGGGYILSHDLVEYFAHSQHLMRRARSEDVTVGIHLHNLNVNWDKYPETVFKTDAASPCSCSPTLLVNHKCKQSDMYYMYYSQKETGKICEYQTNKTLSEYLTKTYNIPSVEEKLIIRW